MYLQISGKATRIKNMVCACFMLLITLLLTSCAHLGEYSEQKDYYESFGEILVYDSSFGSTSYSMEDFYNDDMMEEFVSPIDFDMYTCFAIKMNKTIHLDSMGLFFILEGTGTNETIKKDLEYTCYYAKDLNYISTLKNLSDYDMFYGTYTAEGHKIVCDGLGNVTVYIDGALPQTISYTTGYNDNSYYMEFKYQVNDTKTDTYYIALESSGMVVYRNLFPTSESYKYSEFLDDVYTLFSEKIEINSDDYNSVETSSFYNEDKETIDRIDILEDEYLIITINNNIFGHEKKFLDNVSIKMTGIMIRSSLTDD